MTKEMRERECGFTVLELTVVLLAVGIIAAIATPQITNAMREYRIGIATRRLVDLIQQAKTQAVTENRRASLLVDTANRKMGLLVFDTSGNPIRTDYVDLPDGITFSMPPNVSAPMPGAPTASAVSFPSYNSSTTVLKQDFTSRGFPAVVDGTVHAIYFGNGRGFRAITLNSVGGIRAYVWDAGRWETPKK